LPPKPVAFRGNRAGKRAQAPLAPRVLLRCSMTPLAFGGELSHMQPIGAWAGNESGLLDK
ncbi:hypothetical protein, partial [Mesorhizobium sp.]|uniref:hypothetical protein n=1 Tax=Mesorhizobium sp. TaxID=1871066 RepID=UPI0025DEC25F